MTRVKDILRALWCVAWLALVSAGGAVACNVPVFRYALELWEPDPYPVVLLYNSAKPALPAGVEEYLLKIEESGTIRYRELDVQGYSPTARALAGSLTNRPLPLLVFLYPVPRDGDETSLRSLAVLDPPRWGLESVKAVCESPLRDAIARRLLAGDAAVWVFCEGPDREASVAARRMLDETLKRAESTLELPEQTDVTEESGRAIEGLKIRFPVVTLPHDAKALRETVLRDMLLAAGGIDTESVSAPMAFAVFGRARALPALTGDEFTVDAIMACCEFLTGACSCEAKQLNPGADLLIPADWMGGVESLIRMKVGEVPLAGFSDFAGDASTGAVAASVPVPTPPVATAVPAGRSGIPLRPLLMGACCVVGVAMMAMAGLRWRR